MAASSQYSINSKEQLPWYPPFIAGAAAGLAQSVVATPLDSLRIRFEVEDMVNGRYHSWWSFVKGQLSDDGWRGLYRGLKLTMLKDVAGYAGFFGLFEWIKNETIDLYRDLIQVACTADIFDSDSDIQRLTKERAAELRGLLSQDPEMIEAQGWIIRNPIFVLPVLFLPPILGKPACVLFAGGIAALAYQAIDYPLEQFRAQLYSEVATGEVMKQKVSQHFMVGVKNAHSAKGMPGSVPPGKIVAQLTPYKVAWRSLKDSATREYPRPVKSEVFKSILAIRSLYNGWAGVALRSIPAASLGLVAYEMLKSQL
ncbi:hypothetical protein FBU59_002450 [Linderina macrospora]|uniref:Uncharacterized protein n=1 Tax=Linderina macrospora TaxID=4868 RepID=A0ACC1JBG7_9FUNG|nr:hypothetical protein FBU59_002450 [Linderina macrospora]